MTWKRPPESDAMLIRMFVIIGTLTMITETYKLCSCCYDPAIYRGVELNGSVCVHVHPVPPGIKDAGRYIVSNEDIKLVEEFLRDYVYYPKDLPAIIGLNGTLSWSMELKRLIDTPNSSSYLYYTRKYATYIEDKETYKHTFCCDSPIKI